MSMKAFVLNCPVELCDISEAIEKSKNAIDTNNSFEATKNLLPLFK